ncbi:MAG: hypothetical protein ACRYFW_02145 [Janthinobacterium lividum]
MILLRTTRVGDRERRFADDLAESSGFPVTYLVDGRRGPVPEESRPLIAVTDEGCARLGLPLVDYYAWRCGDYGLYLARERFPDADFFWLIEGDVRFSRFPATAFFDVMARSDADLLAGYLEPARPDWFWYQHGRGRDVTPYRCLYSTLRASVPLIDTMYQKRARHGRSLARRSLWSNDEVFTATTAVNGDFVALDFNDLDGPWYAPEYYEYKVTLDGDALPDTGERPQLLHSVRYGADLARRAINPPLDQAWHFKGRRKVSRQLIRRLPW